MLKFVLFELLCIFGYGQVVDHVLDIAVEESLQIVDSVADAVVGDAALREVVGANLG